MITKNTMSGTKLRYLLVKNNKTGKDLANFLSITQVQVSRWVNGIKPIPKAHLKSIAKYFGISVKELTEDVDEKYQKLYDSILELPIDERIDFVMFILSTIKTGGTGNEK